MVAISSLIEAIYSTQYPIAQEELSNKYKNTPSTVVMFWVCNLLLGISLVFPSCGGEQREYSNFVL